MNPIGHELVILGLIPLKDSRAFWLELVIRPARFVC